MRRWTMFAGTLAGAGLAALCGSVGQAAGVQPTEALLTNASGQTNGCVAEIPSLALGRASGPPAQPLSIVLPTTLVCGADANVYWYSFSSSFYEVMPDKSRRVVYGPGLSARGSVGPGPLDYQTGATIYYPCSSPGASGTHTWLFRATVKTKHDKDDAAPFTAKVNRRATLTCP